MLWVGGYEHLDSDDVMMLMMMMMIVRESR